jgi:hypothetical protein
MRPVFPPLTIGPPSYDRRTRGLDRRIHSCKISIVDGPGSGLDRLKRSSFKKHQRWPDRRRWAKDEQLTAHHTIGVVLRIFLTSTSHRPKLANADRAFSFADLYGSPI